MKARAMQPEIDRRAIGGLRLRTSQGIVGRIIVRSLHRSSNSRRAASCDHHLAHLC